MAFKRVLLLVLLGCLAATSPAYAQKRGKAEEPDNTISGKLVELKRAGRNLELAIETEGGEKKTFTVPSRANVEATAKGDEGFLQPKQYVSAHAVFTNNRLFAQELTVVVGSSRRLPSGIRKAPPKPGQSKNAMLVAGDILARQKDKDYPRYDALSVRTGARPAILLLEREKLTVNVQLEDPALIPAGSSVEIEGRPASRNRFLVTGVKITVPGTLKAEDVLKDGDDREKPDKGAKKARDK